MRGEQVVKLEVTSEEAKGILDEFQRVLGEDTVVDYPYLWDLRDLLLNILNGA